VRAGRWRRWRGWLYWDPDAVMVHATQTHSAPPLGHFMFDKDFPNLPPDLEYLHGGESPYSEFAAERATEAIGRAVECVPLVLNGCCGNINPWSPFEPDFVPDHRRMGNALAERASAVIRQMQFAEVRHLDWRVRRVPLALKAPDPERLSEAERILAAHPEPLWSEENPRVIDPQWYRAASVKSVELLRRREGRLLYEIQAFRVGETAFVAHGVTQYAGYVPTRDAHRRGGHEVNVSFWAKLAPDALDTIVENATGLLEDLFPAKPVDRQRTPLHAP